MTSSKLGETVLWALCYTPCKQERPTGATLGSPRPPTCARSGSPGTENHGPYICLILLGALLCAGCALLFSARCTQCPRVTAIRVCTAITRVGGRVVRAPGSGTAGRSMRAGLVLLQSPAFRNAYIIQLLGGGMGIWLSYRIPAFPRSLVFGRKQGPWLFNYYCDGRAQVLSVGQVLGCFFFFLGHYCKGHCWPAQVHNLPAFLSASSPVIT